MALILLAMWSERVFSDSRDVTALSQGQEFQPLAQLLTHLGKPSWLASVWAAGSENIPFPAAWDRLRDPVFWRRRLTVALAEQARDGLGTVASKNMRGTRSLLQRYLRGPDYVAL